MLFIDGSIDGSSVHLARRRDDHTPYLGLPTGLQNIERAAHICSHIGGRSDVGVRNADESSKVKNDLATLDQIPHQKWIGHIPQSNVQSIEQFCRQQTQMSDVASAVITSQRPHLMAFAQQ